MPEDPQPAESTGLKFLCAEVSKRASGQEIVRFKIFQPRPSIALTPNAEQDLATSGSARLLFRDPAKQGQYEAGQYYDGQFTLIAEEEEAAS